MRVIFILSGFIPIIAVWGLGNFCIIGFFRFAKQIIAIQSGLAHLEFHRNIGFNILNGNVEVDGIQVSLDYNHPGDPKVLFEIKI